VGYRPGAFCIAGSWGTGWANRGFAWIADAFIGSSFAWDFYLVNAAPVVREAA
jgi:hypothetical protein